MTLARRSPSVVLTLRVRTPHAEREDYTRRGLTLIELLVVIMLILVLASLAVLITPRLSEDQRAARSADVVSGFLLMAKQRAYRDQQARGVRLVLDTDNPLYVKELVFIERPEDYRGGVLDVPSPFATSASPPPGVITVAPAFANATAFVHGKDLTNGNTPVPPVPLNPAIVESGDFLVFDSLEIIPYNSHRIYSLTYVVPGTPGAPNGGTHIVCATYDATRYSVMNSGAPIVQLSSDQFRFVRGARPLAGETNLHLPRDMVIDLSPAAVTPGASLPWTNRTPALGDLDIMFSPRGQVMGYNAIDGKIVLRLRNATRPNNEGEQLYVVVYTRTGYIAAHPVNLTADALGNIDYYLFLKDGNSSGL